MRLDEGINAQGATYAVHVEDRGFTMARPLTPKELADKYGIWLEQGRKRLVEWIATNDRTSGDSHADLDARLACRDASRTWTAALKKELEADFGSGQRALVNFAKVPGVALGRSEPAELEQRLIALRDLVAQLLVKAGQVTA